MSWTTQVRGDVDPRVRSRGEDYFRGGRVRIVNGDDAQVKATVGGSQLYLVTLEREHDQVDVDCSCPYFADRQEPCKHIWAVVLAAEQQGFLLGETGKVPKRLIPVDEEYEDKEYDDDDEDYADFGVELVEPNLHLHLGTYTRQPLPPPGRPKKPTWKQLLSGATAPLRDDSYGPPQPAWYAACQFHYVIDASVSRAQGQLVLDVVFRTRKMNGEWSKPKSRRLPGADQLQELPDPADRQILASLAGAREAQPYYGYAYQSESPSRYALSFPLAERLLPEICATGRCHVQRSEDPADLLPLLWDGGEPWEFWVRVAKDEAGKHYGVSGELRRGAETRPVQQPALLIEGGLVFDAAQAARLQDFGAFPWIALFRQHEKLVVPIKDADELLKTLLASPHLPALDLPEELRYERVQVPPRPCLKVKAPEARGHGRDRLRCEIRFDYQGIMVPRGAGGSGVFQAENRHLILRDPAAEAEAEIRLTQLQFKRGYYPYLDEMTITAKQLPKVIRTLSQEGWYVEADGKLYRQPGEIKIEVSSGIDWFELHGSVQFGDSEAKLPELLQALRRGESTVTLDDGTLGILPEDWLKKYGPLAGLGTAKDDHLRFTRSQVGLLDALLMTQPQASCDAVFAKARDELRAFDGIAPADAPEGFSGELRAYQRDGLGWLLFLQRFSFGGCLADDMGLGKTVQVLALLESRRELRARTKGKNGKKERPGPSLVVVPRSLVFNWMQEAARFSPGLRVLDHSTPDRSKSGEHFDDHDVILTTYGTLRRDALLFKDLAFDYCILDEAQAIKNASTESAKAVRLLKGRHRLVLSGTPIENHLGELWSLFEFLNPGMLGSASVLRLGGAGARNPDEETRTLLARALRPFILRRTKQQVAKDLPQKTEQTLYCDLEPAQRKQYDELRDHYRRTLLAKVERDGLNKSKIMVLEALLRLRQAACHLGLIDKKRLKDPSAKLDLLLPQLAEVCEEGHKVLVFSQFTSLLAIVKDRLNQEGIVYEYLDGKTRDRAGRVERFQSDPSCKVFLISLKAGGLGLNLTAAEYVYLLDPWWNPAVEAQAIDRAHRIGQKQPVFAYRVIARDTVEEKVLELQRTKRDLADAIINADNSLIRNLAREDLELLLS